MNFPAFSHCGKKRNCKRTGGIDQFMLKRVIHAVNVLPEACGLQKHMCSD